MCLVYGVVCMMLAEDIENIMQILHTRYGSLPDTELKYENNYQLLIAIMLSAQSTDKQVNKITPKLFSYIQNPQDAVRLGVKKINDMIKSVNYHNTKAKNIVLMSKKLLQEYNSMVPNDFDKLVSLNGVGRKTANVIQSVVFQKAAMAVDTHVFRVSHRIGLVPDSCRTPLSVERMLTKYFPKEIIPLAHHWLILHGRYVCTARSPKCEECGILHICARKFGEFKK